MKIVTHILYMFISALRSQARVQGGGRQGAWTPPPLEIEKQKKKKKKGHQGKFSAISPIFCYFCSLKYHFLSSFLSWAPPPEKFKKKK